MAAPLICSAATPCPKNASILPSFPPGYRPSLIATHDAIVSSNDVFWRSLITFHRQIGSNFTVGNVGKRTLDLHQLYCEVTKRDGYDKVGANRKWKEVAVAMQISSTSASTILKKEYFHSLYPFETVHYNCRAPDVAAEGADPAEAASELATAALTVQAWQVDTVARAAQPTIVAPPVQAVPAMHIPAAQLAAASPPILAGSMMQVPAAAPPIRAVWMMQHPAAAPPSQAMPVRHIPTAAPAALAPPIQAVPVMQVPTVAPPVATPPIQAVPVMQVPANKSGQIKRKRSSIKKPMGLPKRARSAYNLYMKENYAAMKAQFSNRKPSELLSLIALAWNRLTPDQRTVYRRSEYEDKVRHQKEREEYEKMMKAARSGPQQFKGTVEAKIHGGYTISVQIGSETLQGVLFHPGAAVAPPAATVDPPAATVDPPAATVAHSLMELASAAVAQAQVQIPAPPADQSG